MFEFLKNLFSRKNKATPDSTGASDDVEKTMTAAALTDFVPTSSKSPSGTKDAGSNNIADADSDWGDDAGDIDGDFA